MRSQEDVVCQSQTLAPLQEEVLPALTLPGRRGLEGGGGTPSGGGHRAAAAGFRGQSSSKALAGQQLLLLLPLLVLHLLQLLCGLNLCQLLAFLTHLLRSKDTQRKREDEEEHRTQRDRQPHVRHPSVSTRGVKAR